MAFLVVYVEQCPYRSIKLWVFFWIHSPTLVRSILAMSRSFVAGIGLLLLAFALPSQCQYHYGAIASCSDFECDGPNSCNLQGNSYFSAGMLPFETPFGPNLTWTMALRGENHNTSNAYTTWIKDYYLGSPSDLDLEQEKIDGYLGCAAFFVDSNASFPLRQPPGTCNDVIGRDCVHALRNIAISSIGNHTADSQELCSKMEYAFNGDLSPACSVMGLKNQTWGRVKFRRKLTSPARYFTYADIKYPAIIGSDAPQPPSAQQNQSTSCHPIIPASYELAPALSFQYSSRDDSLWNSSFRLPYAGNSSDSIDIDDFQNQQAVPVLSMFTTEDGEDIWGDVSCLSPAVEGANEVTHRESAGSSIRPGIGLGLSGLGFYGLSGLFLI